MNNQRDLSVVLQSHFPIITIETHEEHRCIDLLHNVLRTGSLSFYVWTMIDGIRFRAGSAQTLELQRENHPSYYEYEGSRNVAPTDVLKYIKKSLRNSVIALVDFHPHMQDALIIRLLKEIALDFTLLQNKLVFVSHELNMPAEIQRMCAKFSLSLPNTEQLRELVNEEAKVWTLKHRDKVKADKASIDLLVRSLQGLTFSDARRLIRNAIYHDGAITQEDLPDVMKAKYDLIGQNGILSFEYDTAKFSDIGGFKHLLSWLAKRKAAFLQAENSLLDMPKGILLLGVQGGGKSLAAKAVAGSWQVPLLRFDFGALYNKYIGETEKNIRHSLSTAEIMSPCVLWIDEIEKGISGSDDNDSGTSRRVLGSLLTWMAEKKKPVFIVATANDVQSLPAELIRKGRLDEIFFVDLPDHDTRKDIFKIHLVKRGLNTTQFDFDVLASSSEGFAGAEIEQAIVGALYTAHANRHNTQTQHLLDELAATHPLSKVMSEHISRLRHWAVGRTVSAG